MNNQSNHPDLDFTLFAQTHKNANCSLRRTALFSDVGFADEPEFLRKERADTSEYRPCSSPLVAASTDRIAYLDTAPSPSQQTS